MAFAYYLKVERRGVDLENHLKRKKKKGSMRRTNACEAFSQSVANIHLGINGILEVHRLFCRISEVYICFLWSHRTCDLDQSGEENVHNPRLVHHQKKHNCGALLAVEFGSSCTLAKNLTEGTVQKLHSKEMDLVYLTGGRFKSVFPRVVSKNNPMVLSVEL